MAANLNSELERFQAELKDLGSQELTTPPPTLIGPSPLPVSASPAAPQSQAASVTTTKPASLKPSAASSAASQFTYLSQPLPNPQLASPAFYHIQQQTYQQFQYQQAATSSAWLYQSSDMYSHPQQQQAHVLFQKDAQTINPEALQNVKAALASGDNDPNSESKKRAIPRKAAGHTWEDATLADWPENDYRLFCGDLGNEVNDEVLCKAFTKYPSFNLAKVIRDKRTGKTKGYGFVSFANVADLALAMKEMNGKYVGNRPIKLRKSNWKDRTDAEALEKQKSFKRPKIVKKNVLHK